MKLYQLKSLLVALLLAAGCTQYAAAQSLETPVEYMNYIGKANDELSKKYMVYLSAVSHGKSARKVEKRRAEVLAAISDTRYDIQGMPSYKNDRAYKDSTVAYLKILNSVFNEDYGKIVNMEEIAEQSYDAMEAYMLAQEKANEKLQEAAERQGAAQKAFAAKYNINLLQSTSELDEKMKITNAVFHHKNEVYLIFFKAYKQESYLMDALVKKNINAVEQNINSLESLSDQGLEKLKDVKEYNSDPSLINACKNLLKFYKEEAKKSTVFTEFLLKQENFEKIKKKFDSKPASKRTQQDVDEFNNAVNDINKSSEAYNKTNDELNKKRSVQLDGWNKAVDRFLDTYVPQQRKGG